MWSISVTVSRKTIRDNLLQTNTYSDILTEPKTFNNGRVTVAMSLIQSVGFLFLELFYSLAVLPKTMFITWYFPVRKKWGWGWGLYYAVCFLFPSAWGLKIGANVEVLSVKLIRNSLSAEHYSTVFATVHQGYPWLCVLLRFSDSVMENIRYTYYYVHCSWWFITIAPS